MPTTPLLNSVPDGVGLGITTRLTHTLPMMEHLHALGVLVGRTRSQLDGLDDRELSGLHRLRAMAFSRSFGSLGLSGHEAALEGLYLSWLTESRESEPLDRWVERFSRHWPLFLRRHRPTSPPLPPTPRPGKRSLVAIHGTSVVAPPPEAVPRALRDLEAWCQLQPAGPVSRLVSSAVIAANLWTLGFTRIPAALIAVGAALRRLDPESENPAGLLTLAPLTGRPQPSLRVLEECWWAGDLTAWVELYLEHLLQDMLALEKLAQSLRRSRERSAPVLPLNDRQVRALEEMRVQGFLTNRQYRTMFRVSNKTAHQELRFMVEKKLIRMVGLGRAVRYEPLSVHPAEPAAPAARGRPRREGPR